MAVYSLSGTYQGLESIKNAVNADSNLTLNWDDGGDDINFSHTGLGFSMRIYNMDSYPPAVYIGNGWSSGAEPINPCKLADCTSGGNWTGEMIVGNDYFIIWFRHVTSAVYSIVIVTKLENGAVVAFSSTNESGFGGGYDVINGVLCKAQLLEPSGPMTNSSNEYMATDLYFTKENGQLFENADQTPSKALKFKVLFKPSSEVTVTAETFGNNIVLNLGYANGLNKKGLCILGEGVYL